jgi:YbbR domain-containing protein
MKKFLNDNIHFVVIAIAAIAVFALVSARNNAAILKENGLAKTTTKTTEE